MEKKEYQIIDVRLYIPSKPVNHGLKRAYHDSGVISSKEIGNLPYALSVMADDAGKFSSSLLQKYKDKLPRKRGGVPLHAKLARQLDIAEHEPVSDAGCLRWLPHGAEMVEKARRRIWDIFIDEGKKYGPCEARPIISPVIVSKRDPGVKWLLGNFPEKKYWIEGQAKGNELFLRIAGDCSAFSLHRDRLPSYKELPYGYLEFENDFRYEQSGELRGLHRIREFHMHNIHSICKDKSEAVEVMLQQFNQFYQVCHEFNAEPDLLVAYAVEGEWKRMEKDWLEVANRINKPFLVMLIDKVHLYMCAWLDMVLIDSLGRPIEMGSVQLDIASAKNWKIEYVAQSGKRLPPVIVHAGVGYERLFASMLERKIRGNIA